MAEFEKLIRDRLEAAERALRGAREDGSYGYTTDAKEARYEGQVEALSDLLRAVKEATDAETVEGRIARETEAQPKKWRWDAASLMAEGAERERIAATLGEETDAALQELLAKPAPSTAPDMSQRHDDPADLATCGPCSKALGRPSPCALAHDPVAGAYITDPVAHAAEVPVFAWRETLLTDGRIVAKPIEARSAPVMSLSWMISTPESRAADAEVAQHFARDLDAPLTDEQAAVAARDDLEASRS